MFPLRQAQIERVTEYRKRFPNDIRDDRLIIEAIRRVEKESRYKNIMIDMIVNSGEWNNQELKRGWIK